MDKKVNKETNSIHWACRNGLFLYFDIFPRKNHFIK